MSQPKGRCFYESCEHAPAVPHEANTNKPLCDYHADGELVLDGLYAALYACMDAIHHGFSATLDSLDGEILTVRELYRMPEGG